MNKLIIAGAISLLSAAVFAHDKTLGDSPESYGSPLLDHGQGGTSQVLPENHDHGDNTTNNFVDHDHDRMVAENPVGQGAKLSGMQHDHGDDTTSNFVEHGHK